MFQHLFSNVRVALLHTRAQIYTHWGIFHPISLRSGTSCLFWYYAKFDFKVSSRYSHYYCLFPALRMVVDVEGVCLIMYANESCTSIKGPHLAGM